MLVRKTALVFLTTIFACSFAWAGSELDSEIQSLQVQLVPQHSSQAKRVFPKRKAVRQSSKVARNARPRAVLKNNHLVVARRAAPAPVAQQVAPPPMTPPRTPIAPPSLPNTYAQEENAAPEVQQPEVQQPESQPVRDYAPAAESEMNTSRMQVREVDTPDENNNFLYRVTLIPAASISSFDGPGGQDVIPSGVTNPLNVGPATTLLTDLNILGLQNFVLETGADFIQTGAQTGYQVEPWLSSYTYNERVVLSYAGIPLSAKWLAKGEHHSTFYAKAGLNPVFLVNHAYTAYTGYNEEFRFGGYSTMDVLITAGLGYAFQLGRNYQLSFEVDGYQGTIPVMSAQNVFNVGGTAGVGLSYML